MYNNAETGGFGRPGVVVVGASYFQRIFSRRQVGVLGVSLYQSCVPVLLQFMNAMEVEHLFLFDIIQAAECDFKGILWWI